MAVLGLDTSDFDAKLDKTAKKLDTTAKSMDKAGKKMTLFLTLPLLAAGGAAFKMASDLEENLNKVRVAFGGSAESVIQFSDTTLTAAGISKSAALEMAALFGDMATSMGLPQYEAAQMSKSLVQLAGDVASFKNLNIDQVQTALAGIFTGETESLKRLGYVMTEDNLKVYSLAKGFKEFSNDMDQATKVKIRYAYITDAARNAQGDFMRTQGGAANQMRIFMEGVKQTAAAFGNLLLPIITPAIQRVNQFVAGLTNMTDQQRKNVLVTAAIAAAIGPVLIGLSKMILLVNSLRTAMLTMNIAFATNPLTIWLVIAGAVAASVAGLIAVFNRVRKSAAETSGEFAQYSKLKKELAEIDERAVSSINGEKASLIQLVTALKQTNSGSTERLRLMNEMNLRYGYVLKDIKDEAGWIKEVDKSYKELAKSIINKIVLQKNEQKIAKILDQQEYAKSADHQKRVEAAQSSLAITQMQIDQYKTQINTYGDVTGKLNTFIASLEKQKQGLLATINYSKNLDILLGGLADESAKLQVELQGVFTPGGTNGGKEKIITAYDNLKTTIEAVKTELEALTTKQEKTGKKNPKIAELKGQLLELETQLKNIDTAMELPGEVFTKLSDGVKESAAQMKVYGLDEIATMKINTAEKIRLLQAEMEARRGLYDSGSKQWLSITENYTGLTKQLETDLAGWIVLLEKEKLEEKKKTYKDGIKDLQESLMTEKEYLQYSYDNQVKWVNDAIRALELPVDVGAQLIGKLTTKLKKDLEKIELDESGIEKWEDRWKSAAESIQSSVNMAIGSVVDNMVTGIAESSSIGGIFNDVLSTLADLAIQVGKIALTTGLAIEGIKTALKSLDPALAITAGVALIGLGTWAKGKLADTGGTLSTSGGNNKGFQNYIYNGGFQGLATGGVVKKSGIFTVGEAGRENVYLPAGAAVVPNGGDFSDWKMAGRLYGRDMLIMLKREQSKYKRRG